MPRLLTPTGLVPIVIALVAVGGLVWALATKLARLEVLMEDTRSRVCKIERYLSTPPREGIRAVPYDLDPVEALQTRVETDKWR